jgi:hypothetical protein
MNAERLNTDGRGNEVFWEKPAFAHYKIYGHCPKAEPGPPRSEAHDWSP